MAEGDIDKLVDAAPDEAGKPNFRQWAGRDRGMLALAFTDIVDSTKLGTAIGDPEMTKVRNAHFARSLRLIGQNQGYEVKTIGDSVMAVFYLAEQAFAYARALCARPGHKRLAKRIRAGIHVGTMDVTKTDAFGYTVNYAARVIHEVEDADIGTSGTALENLTACFGKDTIVRDWSEAIPVDMKGIGRGEVHLYLPGLSDAGTRRLARKFPLPQGVTPGAAAARRASVPPVAVAPVGDFVPEPYDIEDGPLVSGGEAWIERWDGADTCSVLGKFHILRTAYLRTKRAELVVSPKRLYVTTRKTGPGELALPDDVQRGRLGALAHPAAPPGGQTDDCVRFCVNAPPGEALGPSALPRIGRDNELEEVAIASSSVKTDQLEVELTIPLKPEGIRVNRKDGANIAAGTLDDIKAIGAILIRKGQAARGDPFARYTFKVKERPRGG